MVSLLSRRSFLRELIWSVGYTLIRSPIGLIFMSEPQALYVLLAPAGQLAGNGQLRETLNERRSRKGDNVQFWYLSPDLVREFNLSDIGHEAVVADEITAINWLKLRFGGKSSTVHLNVDRLRELASGPPPGPIFRDISVSE